MSVAKSYWNGHVMDCIGTTYGTTCIYGFKRKYCINSIVAVVIAKG